MEHQIDPIAKEKMKKNLVYVGIFSIIMLFAGFTSAYIVLMGDSFWLKFPMPNSFVVSTIVVVCSSLTFYLALYFAKKDKGPLIKVFMSFTVVLGLFFVYFQFRGYSELIDNGFYATNNHILVVDGRYGDYFTIEKDGKLITVNGNSYQVDGKDLQGKDLDDLKSFVEPFLDLKQGEKTNYPKWNKKQFALFYNNAPVESLNGYLIKSSKDTLQYVDLSRLKSLARNIIDDRGDFFAKGYYGKDFEIIYKGEKLEYKVEGNNRFLTLNGQPLSESQKLDSMQAADSASSFLYVITFVHLLHIIVALIYLFRLTMFSFSNKFNAENHLSLKTGSIFWHFLGVLWVYLLLFLIYIH